MSPRQRQLINVAGLVVFFVALGWALHQSPPRLSEISISWLLYAAVATALALATQAAQTHIFLKAEGIASDWKWAAWFSSEKAWINTILPAKAGTAGALALLRSRFGLSWSKYLRFLLQCGVITVGASAAGASVVIQSAPAASAIAPLLILAAAAASRLIYRSSIFNTALLAVLAALNLVMLAVGLGACLQGLGYAISFSDIVPAAVALNLLSVAAFTPGNFGVREIVLAAITPVLPISFGAIIQASTLYVFIRTITSFILATSLRNSALKDTSVAQ